MIDLDKIQKPLVMFHEKCITQDGFCAAYLAALRWPDAELLGVNYQDPAPPPVERVHGRDVLIVDFSFKRPLLEEYKAAARSLLVLDHHDDAEKELAGLDYCVFDQKRSGAGLALDHFFPWARLATWGDYKFDSSPLTWTAANMAVHIEDIDLWKFELDGARNLQIFLEGVPRTVEAWKGLPPIQAMKDRGAVMRDYQRGLIESLARNAYEVEWPEGKILAVNSAVLKNEIADALLRRDAYTFEKFHKPQEIPEAPAPLRACVVWYRNEQGKIVGSIRTHPEGIAANALARKLGGAGHVRASGFALPVGWTTSVSKEIGGGIIETSTLCLRDVVGPFEFVP